MAVSPWARTLPDVCWQDGPLPWQDARFVAVDFETSGNPPEYALQPWRVAQGTAWVTYCSITRRVDGRLQHGGGRNPQPSQLEPMRSRLRALLTQAVRDRQVLVCWNGPFDIQWFLAYGCEDLVRKVLWVDGMLLWRHWFLEPEYDLNKGQRKSYGLKAAVAEFYPPFAGYGEGIDFHSDTPETRALLATYANYDTAFTYNLARKFWRLLAAEPQRLVAALIEAQCLVDVAQTNYDGMLVDPLHTRWLQAELARRADESLDRLRPHGVTDHSVISSPTKLAALLFDQWGLPVLKETVGKKTSKINRSTDKDVLHELALLDERAQGLRKYRGYLGNSTKFAKAPLVSSAYNGDGRTHPQTFVFGTYTGRMTVSSNQGKGKALKQTGFPLHQAPNVRKHGKMYRESIVAPPGWCLMEFDAAGQEYRWMAIASQDPTMLQLCEPGEDPHAFFGAQVSQRDYQELKALCKAGGDPEADDARQGGKVGNLSLQYRTSGRTFRIRARTDFDLDLDQGTADYYVATYRQTYLQVPKYWDQQIRLTKQRGWVETFAGRRVQVVGSWSGNFGWKMGSTAINYRIQGTGGDQKYLAMMRLRTLVEHTGSRFAWDLHDGLYYWVPLDRAEEMSVKGRRILDHLPYHRAWNFQPPIPMPWDCKHGPSWGNLEKTPYG